MTADLNDFKISLILKSAKKRLTKFKLRKSNGTNIGLRDFANFENQRNPLIIKING